MNRNDNADRMYPKETSGDRAARLIRAANACATCLNTGVVVDSATGYPDVCPKCVAPTQEPGGPPREIVMLLHTIADKGGFHVNREGSGGHSYGSWRRAERGGWLAVHRTENAQHGSLTQRGWDAINRAPKPEHVIPVTGGWNSGPCLGGGIEA